MSVKFYTKDEKNELRDLAVNIRQLSVAEIADNIQRKIMQDTLYAMNILH